MNNAKMWLVVKPTVGVPLFLTAVALGSFSVHVAVLSNTSWVSRFLNGEPVMKAAEVVVPGNSLAATEGTLVLPDGRTAKVVFGPEVVAAK